MLLSVLCGQNAYTPIENRPKFSKKEDVKANSRQLWNIERELENFCNEDYHLLSEFHVYGLQRIVLNDGLIAWIRAMDFMRISMEELLTKPSWKHLLNIWALWSGNKKSNGEFRNGTFEVHKRGWDRLIQELPTNTGISSFW